MAFILDDDDGQTESIPVNRISSIIVALSIVFLVLLILFTAGLMYYRSSKSDVGFKGVNYKVVPRYPDKTKACEILAKTNSKTHALLTHLKKKYQNDQGKRGECVRMLLTNYDFDYLRENDPIWAVGHKAFTVDMKYISICLRKKDGSFYDDNLLYFVFLHELSHAGTDPKYIIDDHHPPMFWAIFGFLMTEAVNLGIIKPSNYERENASYCDVVIAYNPYYDDEILSKLDN
jgi:hypothetical protein